MLLIGLCLAGLFAVTTLGIASPQEVASAEPGSEKEKVLTFDVAENASRFVYDENPVHDDGMPAYGNAFITQGYIYPHGTLSGGNGVLADGSPEFPEKVMGSWTCRGWFIGDGAHTESGAWVISTQLYDFGAGTGPNTLVSEGLEGAVKQKTFQRAVIGGTGSYKGSEGIVHQKLLGFNRAEGVNLRFKIRITND